jgi:excisionase family DNA binding protein
MNRYTPRKPQLERTTYDVAEIAALLNVSLPNAYALTRRVGFPVIRFGRRIIIPREAFHRWLERTAFDTESSGAARR